MGGQADLVPRLADLLDAVRAHLVGHQLPPLSSVHVTAFGHVTMQVYRHRDMTSAAMAGELLQWAQSLAWAAVEVWRVPGGHDVHLAVRGQLPGGVGVEVYGAAAFAAHALGGDLQPGASAPISLTTLRHAAGTWGGGA